MTFQEYRSIKYFPVLDSLRAISILLVLTVHLGDNAGPDGVWRFLSGQYGVPIFFVMSGYLITLISLREEEKDGSLSLFAFYIRRSFRILPLYVFTLSLMCFIFICFGSPEGKRVFYSALPYYLTYMNEFAPTTSFMHSWSLGIEEKFYLCWPLFAFVLVKNSLKHKFLLTLSALIFFEYLHIFRSVPMTGYYSSILVGCIIAIALQERRVFNKLALLGQPKWVYFTFALFLAAQLALKPYEYPLKHVYPYVVGLSMTSLVMSGTSCFNWLKCRCFTYLGERSYGIYLVHILCLKTAEKFFPPGSGSLMVSSMALLLTTIFSIGFAELLHRLIEKPLIAVGRNWSMEVQSRQRLEVANRLAIGTVALDQEE